MSRQCLRVVLTFSSLVIGCGALFPVVQDSTLSDVVLTRIKTSKYAIVADYSSKLPDDYQVQFDPSFPPQPYNINSQTKGMYQEYFQFKSNQSNDKELGVHITIDSFETTYREEGGLGAQLSGTHDIKRSATIQLTVQVRMPDGSVHAQKIAGRETLGIQGADKHGTWMAVYSSAVNKAINKSIIMTDGFIEALAN